MYRTIITFALFAFIFAVDGFGQSAGREEPALRTLIKQMTDAQLAFDAKTLDRIFTPDYIEISPVGEFDTREKVLGFYKPELKPDPSKISTSVEVTDHSFRYDKVWAIVIVRLNFAIVVDGKAAPPRSMRATAVCRKERGQWKIATVQYTGIRPPAPAKTT